MAVDLRLSKRIQVDKAKATTLSIVVGAVVIAVFALAASRAFFSEAAYLNKVAGEKSKALKQLKDNKAAVDKLVASYKSFADQDPNMLGGSNTGSGERDGDNGRLVLDALPSKYDFPALTTSLEKLLGEFTINGITGVDDAAAQSSTTTSTNGPVAMPFTVDVGTDYPGVLKLLSKFEKSIRPFQVQTLTLSGTNKDMEVAINAQTFYQPETKLTIGSKVVK